MSYKRFVRFGLAWKLAVLVMIRAMMQIVGHRHLDPRGHDIVTLTEPVLETLVDI